MAAENSPLLHDSSKQLLLKNRDWKTLIILGNGFDRMHGLPTRYCDFKEYLMQDRDDNFAEHRRKIRDILLSDCFDQSKLWSDFERILGQPNFEKFLEFFSTQTDEGDFARWLTFTMMNLSLFFCEWVKQIEIKKENAVISPEIVNKYRDSAFLNFNYTDTLETVYDIPDDGRIFHIHGKAKRDNAVVIGHNNENIVFDEKTRKTMLKKKISLEEVQRCYQAVTNKGARDRADRFNIFLLFLAMSVKNVYILGHSLSDVDMSYFIKIKDAVREGCVWHISLYGDRDQRKQSIKNALTFADTLGIPHEQLRFFDADAKKFAECCECTPITSRDS